ncbi:hypothetical protein AM1_A0078 (plasmid) [Acaryochloris marina MBIC11017]|uniref:Uncharacterized protein n=1 Tax=Acaryochloris marina (strain MBIC 11017) TaxID=329726 RepID=A8ZK87_ACAM1|nr:hypothetical protein AM1_A0078 [Acaryochloris marina MBIC11017]
MFPALKIKQDTIKLMMSRLRTTFLKCLDIGLCIQKQEHTLLLI